MLIELLLFGIVKDVIGKSAIHLQIPENTSIADFRVFLLEKFPKLKAYDNFSVAVNETYVDENHIIREHNSIALIPPVSGG